MLTAQEKAKELIETFRQNLISNNKRDKIRCALIHVKEIIVILETLHKPEYTAFIAKELYAIEDTEYDTHIHGYELLAYFRDVQTEIEKKLKDNE